MLFTDTILQKKNYPVLALFNFVVLAFGGVLLRYMHCFSLAVVNYQFLMHSHSHFAFAGWMFLSIILLFLHHYENEILEKQLKKVVLLTLVVSFGMLISFYLTGYKAVSIILSTTFIFVGYWFVYLAFKTKTFITDSNRLANMLLRYAFVFLLLSSVGPFALGYFKSAGFKSTALQQNAIYFYLHFQLNGFMQLALLGLFLKSYLKENLTAPSRNTVLWLKVFAIATLPLYAMFTLWTKPAMWVYELVFVAAAFHFIAWLILFFRLKSDLKSLSFLARIAILAISLQFFFQVLIAFPVIGDWAFGSRNLIIGYIHLLTLGSLSPLIIDLFTRAGFLNPSAKLNYSFIIVVVAYLMLLFGSAFLTLFKVYIPNLGWYLFGTNLLLPFIGIAYFINSIYHQKQNNDELSCCNI